MTNRQIFVDTETTGLKVKDGHRIVEIAALEMLDGKLTGRKFHTYVNPEGKQVESEALSVHGLTNEFLSDKPTFKEVASDFVEFVRGDEVLMHNSDFDIAFINAELDLIQMPPLWDIARKVTCTLKLAQSIDPSKRCSLDKLCERYGVDNSHRELHGALLDCELLAEVYVKMNESAPPFIDDEEMAKSERGPIHRIEVRPPIPLISLSEEDARAHEQYLDSLSSSNKGATPVWRTSAQPKAMKP